MTWPWWPLGDHDCAPWCQPPLTTFQFALARLAHVIVEMTQSIMQHQAVRTTHVAGELVVRQSCGASLHSGKDMYATGRRHASG